MDLTLRPTPYHYPLYHTIWLGGLTAIMFFRKHICRPSMERYVLLRKHLLTTPPIIFVLEKLIWDHLGRGHLCSVKILSPATNNSMSTAQIDLSIPDKDWHLPPLHPPMDRYQHSHLWINPTTIRLWYGLMPIYFPYPGATKWITWIQGPYAWSQYGFR